MVTCTYAATGKETEFSMNIPEVILWEPANPHLYEITISIAAENSIDCFTQHFGMREIAYMDGEIILNNKPLYIRGALDQAFYPDTIYTAPNDEYIKNEINLAKSMGFNLLRKHIEAHQEDYRKPLTEKMNFNKFGLNKIFNTFEDLAFHSHGWLDYLRTSKYGFERLKDFNGELVIITDKVNHNLWTGDKQEWDLNSNLIIIY